MFLCTCLSSCQSIPESEQLTPVDPSSVVTNRTTLLCEFSGYRCINCPTAAEEAHKMLQLWDDKLVVVEMHPPSSSFTKYTKEEYNYTCPAADIYYKHFSGENSLPTGVLNLAGSFTDYKSWGGAYIRSAIAQSAVAMSARADYDATSRILQTAVTFDNLQQRKQSLRLIAWLTEDSIIGAQMVGSVARLDYCHNHLLRDALTTEWGEPLILETSHTHTLSPYKLPDKCNPAHCHLVLLALRNDEVIQALQIPIIQNS